MLSFNNAVGNLFNIIGKCAALVKNAKSNQSTQLIAITSTSTGLTAQLNALPNVQTFIGQQYISQLNNIGSVGQLAQSVAQTALNTLVFNDNPQLAQTLQQLQITTSLQELIRQMKVAGATVQQATGVTAKPLNSTNQTQFTYPFFIGTGNGVITASVNRPSDGLLLENVFAENLKLFCTADSYSGTATAGNESFALTGTGAETNQFAYDWPLGSNASTSLNAINGNANNSQGNGLTNSGFNTFSGNVPTNWVLEVGTAGTNINQENSVVYDGAAAVRLTGDGTTLTAFSQTFGTSTGTSASLAPQSQYSINVFLRRDGTAAGAGTLVVELTDSTGTVINDANGVPNTFSINLTTLSTVYSPFSGVFRTPVIMPTVQQKIRLRMSTALSNGRSVYIDKMSMGLPTQLYTSGPFVAVHAGNVPFAIGDYAFVQVANSRGGGGTPLSTFQTVFAQFFPMISNNLLLPSAAGGGNTISDSLIA